MSESTILELCEWAMTLKQESDPQHDRYSLLATEVLTCGQTVSAVLLNSATLKRFLTEFLESKGEWDSICTGHFQKILGYLARHSNGAYLSNFPKILEQLTRHLDLLATTELVITLYLEFSKVLDAVSFFANFVATTDKSITSALYALRRLLDEGSEKPEVFSVFLTDEVVMNLVKAANATSDRIAAVEIYRILARIREMDDGLISRYIGLLQKSGLTKCQRAYLDAIQLTDLPLLVNQILDGTVHWSLGNRVLAELKGLSELDLGNLLNESAALQKLKNIVNSGGVLSAFQLSFVQIIGNSVDAVGEEVARQAALIGTQFGGELPVWTERKVNAE
jgi:hypothetical protein